MTRTVLVLATALALAGTAGCATQPDDTIAAVESERAKHHRAKRAERRQLRRDAMEGADVDAAHRKQRRNRGPGTAPYQAFM